MSPIFQKGDLIRLNPSLLQDWGFPTMTLYNVIRSDYNYFPLETVFLVVETNNTRYMKVPSSFKEQFYIVLSDLGLCATSYRWAHSHMSRV